MAKQAKEQKALDREITRIYTTECEGIQIDLFDIPKVFRAAYKAKEEGQDMKQAIVDFVQSIRKN